MRALNLSRYQVRSMIQNNIKHANAANIWDQAAGLHPSALERQNSRDPWLTYPSMFLYTALRHEANKRQLHQVMKAETWPYIYKWKLVDWGSLCPKLLLIHPRLNSDLLWNWEKEYEYIQHPGCNEQNIISKNIKSFLKIGIHCSQWWYIMPGICQEKACKICHCWFSLAILPFRHGGSWTQLRFVRCFLDPLQLQPHGFKEPTCWYVCPIWCPTSTGDF